jgi:hypothetical protein
MTSSGLKGCIKLLHGAVCTTLEPQVNPTNCSHDSEVQHMHILRSFFKDGIH